TSGVPNLSQFIIFSRISAIIIPTNKPLLINGRIKAGIDSKYVAGNVIIIVPTNKGIADRYTFNVLSVMFLKNSIEELNNCKYATNKTALPILNGNVEKNVPTGSMTPIRKNIKLPIMNGKRSNIPV